MRLSPSCLLLTSFLVTPSACFEEGASSLAEGECRTQADCTDGKTCFDADDPFYGDCDSVQRECETDPECGDGNVCADYLAESPCDPSEFSSHCVVACLDDTTCLDGERCDTATGHCVVWSCSDGYTCPAHHTCAAAAEGTGCERDACSDDADCGDGWCVNSACFTDPGFCSFSPP